VVAAGGRLGVKVWFLLGAVGLVAAATWTALRWEGREVAPPPPPPPVTQSQAVARLSATARARGVQLPDELTRAYPPRTRVTFALPLDPRDFEAGLACPGGGFLPLLNGVPHAQPLHRNLELHGPLPPVIGKYVDADGDDWYVHADGSETTTRWTTIAAQGVSTRDVRTDHTVPARGDHGLPARRQDQHHR
jgi:hypothetical protein